MTTLTRDDDNRNIYTVLVGRYNELASVHVSKYEEKCHNAIICPGEYISKRNQTRYQKKRQCAYTLLLVHLTYSISKAIIINLFYHTWHQDYIIWVMNMRHNISSGVRKNIFWKLIIKVG